MSAHVRSGPPHKKLSARQAEIVKILLRTPGEAITIKTISSQMGISVRTIIRELSVVESWLTENNFKLIRKPSVGIILAESGDNLALLKELIFSDEDSYIFRPEERQRRMLGELLSSKEPIKSYVFLSRYQISRATLTADLNKLEQWLEPCHVKLSRRPGAGILLEGTETAIRHAIASAAFEFVDESELLNLIRDGKKPNEENLSNLLTSERLFQFIDNDVLEYVEQLIRDTEKQLDLKYTDSGYMALVVHLSLAIKRLINGDEIDMSPDELAELSHMPEYTAAQDLAEKVSKHFNIKVPPAECGFITMHLSSTRTWPQSKREQSQLRSVNTRQVVMNMIDSVEKEVNIPFHSCDRMIEELSCHMDAMISRLTMNTQLDSSQNDELREEYPVIYSAVENACHVFCDTLHIKDVTTSEVSFVAMHFIAAAEQLQIEQNKVSAAVVCPSGIGASRLLAANLMRAFSNIEVKQISSVFQLNPEQLRKDGIDIVISTVSLDIDYPFVCVSPIPQAHDILLITQAMERIEQESPKTNAEPLSPSVRSGVPSINRSTILTLTHIGEEIFQLIDHFQLLQLHEVSCQEELLGHAAGLFADSLLSRQLISGDLARREGIKSTFIPELNIYLLHCRTLAIEHCRFGYIRLEKPIANSENSAVGAVILLAPQSDRNECLEVISRISMLLVEDHRFLQALQTGDLIGGKALAENSLVKYYEQEIKRLGDVTR